MGGPTAVILLLCSLLYESMGPGSEGWALMAAAPWAFVTAFSTSFLLNFSSFIAIQTTSSLTFKVRWVLAPAEQCVAACAAGMPHSSAKKEKKERNTPEGVDQGRGQLCRASR